MFGSISNPNDKIATDLVSKCTTENRIATGVISASGPHLVNSINKMEKYITL